MSKVCMCFYASYLTMAVLCVYFFSSVASNAVVVVLGALIAWSLCSVSLCSSLKLISNVEPGLPAVKVPQLSVNVLQVCVGS